MSETKNSQYLYIFRSEQNPPTPTPEQMEQIMGEWMAWIRAIREQGRFQSGDPLDDDGKVLRGPKGSTITDGPFVEAKELVAGYFIVTAPDLNAAVEMARGCPIFQRGGSVEVRRIENIPG
ncbi:MAG TPA: YciI family protein [Opitutaceae bacterium]|nr:YciI family protein [Opitutaceae bacterium]